MRHASDTRPGGPAGSRVRHRGRHPPYVPPYVLSPGQRPDGPGKLGPHTHDFNGTLLPDDDDLIQRLIRIASDPVTATATARRSRGAALRPLTQFDVSDAESALGFALPPLLVRLYTEVGNGGFGPGDGLLPLLDADRPLSQADDDETVRSEYRRLRAIKGAGRRVWRRVLPIVDHGCGEFSCLFVIEPGELSPPVVTVEPNASTKAETLKHLGYGLPYLGPGLLPTRWSFHGWLTEWANDPRRSPQ